MRILLVTQGSGGDVHPYIAMALALQARGHEVWLLSNEYFRQRTEAVGVRFIGQGTREEYLEAVTHPDLVHPVRGPSFVVNTLVLSRARDLYVATRKAIRTHKIDLVVRHLITFAAGWAAEREGVRQVSATLSPMFWLSRHDTPIYKHWQPEIEVRWLAWLRLGLVRGMARWMFEGSINAARADVGLPRLKDVFLNEMVGGERSLGLWSPVFRGPRVDDPAHGRICGFTWFDGRPAGERLDPALERFLDEGKPGDEPIVFTLGTSVVHHAGGFFELAAGVCKRLGRRGVLLTGPVGEGDGAPSLPAGGGVIAVPYAPFSVLLSRGCCTVHHGGIGTTAQGLRAGRPSVVVPFANDEFDNASRVRRLGAGGSLRASRLTPRRLERVLRSVLEDGALVARARAVGAELRAEDGAGRAAEELEVIDG